MKVPRFVWMSILLGGQLLYTGQVMADSWQQNVSSRVATEFDTNPAMVEAYQGGGVWRFLFEPAYTLMGKVGENEITTGLALQIARSSNKTQSPNLNDPTVFVNWLHPDEAGQFGISAKYAEMATRDTGGVDATGNVPAASTRAIRTLSGNWRQELSGQTVLIADSAYEGATYKGGGIYTDYSTRSGGLRFDYIMSEQITSYCRVSGNRYTPANGGPSSSLVDAILGINWKVEYLDWTMEAGKSRVAGSESDTEGSIVAHYTGQQTQMTLNAGRSVSPSGLGGFVKANALSGSWSYALSEYSNTGVNLERRKNFPTAGNTASTMTTAGVWIDYALTPLWKMRTYYQHKTNQTVGFEKVFSNLVGISFAYEKNDF